MARKAKGIAARVWRERLRRWRSSGLRVADFCRFEGISSASFYQWRRRVEGGREAPSREERPVFVPVEVVDRPTLGTFVADRSPAGGRQVAGPNRDRVAGGVTIRVGDDVDDERVRTVLQTVIAETKRCSASHRRSIVFLLAGFRV